MQTASDIELFDRDEEALPFELDQFIERLKAFPGSKPLAFLVDEMQRLSPSRELLEPWIVRDDQVYTRSSIYRDEFFEALVLTWQSGQRSPVHNHRGSSCAVYVVEGTASEIMFEASPSGALFPAGTQHIRSGAACGSYDQEIHQIANLQAPGQDLVSLHVYSPPLKSMELFSLSQTTFADYDDLLIRSTRRAAA